MKLALSSILIGAIFICVFITIIVLIVGFFLKHLK